jgi:chromosomal replication initiator protein
MQGTFTDDKTRSAETQISAINDTLAKKIGPQKFRIWFSNSTRFTLTGGYLKVGVPNLFIASWIEKHFTNEISQAVREVTGETRKVTFAIDPELSGSQRRTQLDSQAHHVPKLESLHSPKDSLLRTPVGGKSKTDKAAPTDKKLRFTLDTFVVGHSNELAFNAAKAVVNEQKSPFNPLFFHGGYGVGKTHLLHGICNAISKSRPQTRWLYLSAEDFANQFILALKLKKLEHFRQKMRQTDLLAIDDIHFLASKPSTQEEFLHTFNTINLAGKQVILASDAHPKMIGQLSEKLVNRFISGMVVKINSPDFQTRCEICQQYAATMIVANFGAPASSCQKTGAGAQKQIPENVIRYVAENLRSNVRELEGAMLKLVAYSALQNEKINLSMAQEVLAEHLARTDPIVHISDIESAVAAYFGLTPANIHSPRKDRTIALARHFSMYLTRKHTKMSSSEIGRFMGNKNHATVLLACRKVEDLLARNVELHWLSPVGNKIAKAKTILAELEASI